MARFRVLQAMGGARRGGAEAFFTRLVLALARAGLEQRVVIRRDAERAAALRAGGIEPVELPFGGPLDLVTTRGLRREIATFRPDVVLTWMIRATQKCPVGPFVHVARLGGYYKLKYFRNCRHLVGNTADLVDYIRRAGWPPERVHYLPNFVDAEPAAPVARASLDTPADAPLVLALGRLHRDKAFDILLPALAMLPGVHCWIGGEGPERAALLAQSRQLRLAERVHFLGWRDDAPALYAAADLFVCPSRLEPLGNVVIEAWARGVPVVAADRYGPRELIEDGRTGLLVPVEDAAALAEAIRRVCGDRTLAARLRQGGRAAYRARFTEAAVVAQYLAFFEKMSAERQRESLAAALG